MSLSRVHAKPKAQPAMSFVFPRRNASQREDMWYQSVLLAHNSFCGCDDPIGHLLGLHRSRADTPSPEGPPPPVAPRIRGLPALPAPNTPVERRHTRTENPSWPGDGGGDAGARGDGDGGEGDDQLDAEDVEDLLGVLDDPE